MYRAEDRRLLAEELARVFLEGEWRAEALAERGAGVFVERPAWIDALAFATVAIARTAPVNERPRVVAFIDGYLERLAGPAEASPPGLVRLVAAPAPGLARPVGAPATWPAPVPALAHGLAIARIPSVGALAEMLELSDGQLAWLADVRGLERSVPAERLRNYRYRWIPRRSGVPRLIEAPKLRLKEVQRWMLREILDAVPPHAAAHGFTRGRSVHTHAAAHVGQAAVLRLDLRDFFASVSAGRVFAIFRALGYEPAVAHALTGLATNVAPQLVWNALPRPATRESVGPHFMLGRQLATPHLPQGAPSSPALANLAAHGLDRRLTGLAAAHELRYTRYADDLTFSGDGLTGARARRLTEHSAEIAREEGFRLHPAKSRLRTAARRQTVTGIVVNAHPNLARDEYDRLKATLHRLALDGPAALDQHGPDTGVDLRAQLNGRVAWIESLNPHRGAKLRRRFDAIPWES